MANFGKVEISSNRHDWSPTPLPEQVVLVTTADAEGRPHVATKSRLAIISYGPPTIVVFACRAEYQTAANIKANGQFVINIPGDDLVATSWIVGSEPSYRGPDLLTENGLTPISSLKVEAPRIAECRAHLECEMDRMIDFGPDLAVFGKIVSASMDAEIIAEDEALCYLKLAPFFFLSSSRTASLSRSRRVDQPVPGPRHNLTILVTRNLERSTDFYADAFDWPITQKRQDYVEFALPDGRCLALCPREEIGRQVNALPTEVPEGRLTGIELYFYCDDLPRTLARLISAGARELSELKERSWGEEAAYFADPDGNILGVTRYLSAVSKKF
jgi:flavin reductase (DIM6/NTAB) family NADH-FMN oxidoreductase RutF/catechol 2,3-dioxygenase-like lactoylglutathione lyase family enzyme